MIPTEKEVQNLILMWRKQEFTWVMIADNLSASIQSVRRWAEGKPISVRNRVAAGKYAADMRAANSQLY